MNATNNPNVFDVIDLARAREKMEKLAKRATKLGVEAPSFEVVGQHLEWAIVVRTVSPGGVDVFSIDWSIRSPEQSKALGGTTKYTGAVRTVHHCLLTGVKEVKFSGWSFLATLDHELGEDMTIVNLIPGAEGKLPKEYRHRGQTCDHCHHNRMRKKTYVCIHEDGRLVQVGSTCIKDFLGHDAASALQEIELYAAARDALEGDTLIERDPDTFDLVEFLAMTIAIIREDGWVSRKEAMESFDTRTATADIVVRQLKRKQDKLGWRNR